MPLPRTSYHRHAVSRALISVLIFMLLCAAPLVAADSGDSTLFIDGFNAYQKGEYSVAVDKMSKVLKEYPATPLRDMALFWLARSNYRAGNRTDAARNMSEFLKEYPEHPLKGTVEEELLSLAARYDRGYTVANVGDAVASRMLLPEKATPVQEPKTETPVTVPAAPGNELAATRSVPAEPDVSATAEKQKPALLDVPAVAVVTPGRSAEPVAMSMLPTTNTSALTNDVSGSLPVTSQVADAHIIPESAKSLQREESAVSEQATEVSRVTGEGYHAVPKISHDSRKVASSSDVQVVAVTTSGAERSAGLSSPVPSRKPSPGKKGRRSRHQDNKALQERAIAEYRATIVRYPDTPAAAEAAARLRELGVDSSGSNRAALPGTSISASQTATVEVEQFADLTLAVTTPATRPEAGNTYAIPFAVVNNGNGADSFSLESNVPLEYSPRFTATGSGLSLTVTPLLAPGETWHGLLLIDIPAGSVDGQKLCFPLSAVSRFSKGVSRTRELPLTVSAPLLRGMIKPDQEFVRPGEQITYRMTLLNIGSAAVRSAQFRLDHPSQLELITSSGIRKESGYLVVDDIRLASGGSLDLSVSFRLKKSALARQELICRGELANPALHTRSIFVSPSVLVSAVSGVTLSFNQERLVAVPGQMLSVPFSITNNGNMKESMSISAILPHGIRAQFSHDPKGNGQRDARQAFVTGTSSLAPDETQHFLMDITTVPTAADGSEVMIPVAVEAASNGSARAGATLRIVYARPVVELTLSGGGGRLRPGDVAIVEMTCLNRGSAVARSVSLESLLPEQMELVATEPAAISRGNGQTWVVAELGAGEKRSFRIISRVRHGIAAGSSLAVTGRVSYEDNQGNRYLP